MKAMPKKCFRFAACCALVIGVCLVFAGGAVQAQPVMVQNATGDLSTFVLPSGGGTATVNIVDSAGFTYNNLGYSSTIDYTGGIANNGSLFAIAGGTGAAAQTGLIQINPATGATTNLGFTTNLPTGTGTSFQSGDVFGNTMWVTFGLPTTATSITTHQRELWTVDLITGTAGTATLQTITGMNANTAVADWAYVPGVGPNDGGSFDGLLFGGDRATGDLWSLNPDTGAATNIGGLAGTGTPAGGANLFGAAWYDPNPTDGGNIFVYRNSPGGTGDASNPGIIYRVNTAGTVLNTWNAPGVVVNDGTYFGGDTLVPIPGAVWLLGSGIIGLAFVRRRFKS